MYTCMYTLVLCVHAGIFLSSSKAMKHILPHTNTQTRHVCVRHTCIQYRYTGKPHFSELSRNCFHDSVNLNNEQNYRHCHCYIMQMDLSLMTPIHHIVERDSRGSVPFSMRYGGSVH